jgi:hypothetical protein
MLYGCEGEALIIFRNKVTLRRDVLEEEIAENSDGRWEVSKTVEEVKRVTLINEIAVRGAGRKSWHSKQQKFIPSFDIPLPQRTFILL